MLENDILFVTQDLKTNAVVCSTGASQGTRGTALAGPPAVDSHPGQLCGIQGTWIERSNVDSFRPNGQSGTYTGHFSGYGRFVSDATGTWIEFASTGVDTTDLTPVDNGDGTYSIVWFHSGTGIVIKTSTGALAPNYGAGRSTIVEYFVIPADGIANANPDADQCLYTTYTRIDDRPIPPDGGDFCADVVLPALT